MRHFFLGAIVLGLALTVVSRADENAAKWGEAHPGAKNKLLMILNENAKLKDSLNDLVNDDGAMMNEFILFLAAKGDRNVNDFRDKAGKEAKPIKKAHAKSPEQMRAFREWIRSFEADATALAQTNNGLKDIISEASATAKDTKKKKK